MLRPAFFVIIGVVGLLAISVYEVEKRVSDLRKELRDARQSIAKDQHEMHVLRAEWSYLNQPRRIEEMSQEVLELAPVSLTNFMQIDDIPLRSELMFDEQAGDVILSQR